MPTRRMPAVVAWFCVVAGLVLAPTLTRAQQPDTSKQKLPEIAPREIEIRGELQLSFPSLDRQPLRGFASPPTIPSVPPDHTPYVESYKQALEDLPESLPAPSTASPSVSTQKDPQRGYVEAGGGRYASRFAAGRYAYDLTPNQTLSLNADYTGTEGFTPFSTAAPDLDTPSDEFSGRIQLRSRHDGFSLQGTAHGAFDRYTLYGQPGVVTTAPPEARDRTGTSGGLRAQARSYGPIRSNVHLDFTRTAYTTDSSASSASSTTFAENRLTLDGRVEMPLAGTTTYADLMLSRSTYGGDLSGSPSGVSLDAGLGARAWNTDRASVDAGLRVLTYNAPRAPVQDPDASASGTYILPEVEAEFEISPSVTVFAENKPTLTDGGLDALYDQNPFAEHAPSVRPTTLTTNAKSGVVVSVGPVRIQTDAGLRYAPSYRFFFSELDSGSTLADAPLQVGYRSARIVHGGGQIALQGIDGVEASVEMYLRDTELVGADAAIPYVSPLVTNAMLSVSFADEKGLLQTSGTIETPRSVNPATDREVDTYVAFDVEGSYQITSLLSGVLRVQNLSPGAPTQWARYARPPASIQAGLRIHW